MSQNTAPPTPEGQHALQTALRSLLQPLARLALARGLQYQALDALLRSVLVEEARQVLDAGRGHGLVSRVSTATGLTRREAGRLLHREAAPQAAPPSRASEVFARWLSNPDYQDNGKPLTLPRSGPAPSFEALARSVTQDVHPRSLLDELCRLELVALDGATDTVTLQRNAFVPRADAEQMLGLLAGNATDHLEAAVANVLGQGDEHFEQALYADELSAESVQALRPLIAAEWARLFQNLAPALERCIADDRAHGRDPDQRVRIGFYSFAQAVPAPDTPPGTHATAPDSNQANVPINPTRSSRTT